MASGGKHGSGGARRIGTEQTGEESSESDGETEPAKSFHRRLSTNREIKCAAATKEGFLMKQTWSFQRWRRRYFKLKGHKLYYAKDTKAVIFDEIDLTDLTFAECSIKNVNHSFQVITPFRRLVLCAESRREMEDWIQALKAASNREYYEAGDHHEFLSGHHHWYATSHARPTYCNVCREALSGVTSHGLSCEVCKCKVHKRCAAKAISNCKWTTLASIGKDIIEDEDGNITMPHQWMEGNLPVSAKCAVCDKTCGSVLRLQDWRCLWCRATVHTACRPLHPKCCPLGPCRVSVVPPTALHSIGNDEAWEAVRPQGCSPLLVFVNSKSGDNQGVKFLRRFKQLLNPAQVFDLISNGPGLGLRLFRHFDPFRILVCSGDGSVGWVLSEIDRLNLHKQCQVGVLPLGTGNDLARVLGWGSSCDDDTHLPQLLEKYEKACTKMLDRWSIMTFERSITIPTRKLSQMDPSFSMAAYEDSVVSHLTKILQSDQHSVVISSAKILCETVKDFTVRAAEVSLGQGDQQFGDKCQVLNEKLDLLLQTLQHEESGSLLQEELQHLEVESLDEGEEKSTFDKPEKDLTSIQELKKTEFVQRDALMSRANSLKKAIRQLVEHTEQAVDEQNKTTVARAGPSFLITPPPPDLPQTPRTMKTLDIPGLSRPTDTLKVLPTIESLSSTEVSPCPSPLSHSPSPDLTARLTAISPLPDLRRDSGCSEDMLTLPVPVEFADEEARRRSLVPSEDEDGFCPSETAIPVPSPAKHMKRFLSLPDDDVLTGTIPSSNIEDRRIFPSKDEKDKGNLAAQVESVQSVEIGISVSCEDALLPPQDVQDDETPPMDLLVISDSQETRRSSTVSLKDMEKDICHIDSPETTEVDPTNDQEDEIPADEEVGISGLHIRTIEGLLQPPDDGAVNLQSELAAAGFEDTGKMILTPSSPEDEVLTPVTPEEKSDSDEEVGELVKGCSLAHFEEGNDIARRSFYKQIKGGAGRKKKSATDKSLTVQHSEALTEQDNEYLGVYKIRIQGSNNNLSAEAASTPGSALTSHRPSLAASEGDDDELLQFHIQAKQREALEAAAAVRREMQPETSVESFHPVFSVIVNPPSPVLSDEGMPDPMRRDSVDSTSKLSVTSPTSGLHCSPAATRRISSGSLLKAPDAVIAAASAQQAGSARDRSKSLEKDNRFEEKIPAKRLPIINPLVRLPMWPNVSGGAGLVSKVLLANADALCAAASPLMDPDETLLEGYYERAVMNNYFGIGIDAKISLDFHQKREEHPEKCRSRAKNYMWYGVLGSKEWLQKTYKNLEQRVQLECDGQRIPLPSLQGIVILNIPSFMGGTNFWGGTKEDDCFLAPSFDDRVLEVVAVFGSVQMAASRLINLQHHRIAQCQTVQITILGEEGVPIQVDGEAWIQPPGMIRIIHKNRMQMLCRNRALETSLRAWEEKQRHQQALSHSQSSLGGTKTPLMSPFSEEENQLLLSFIESVTTLIKYVKLLTIRHPTIEVELYQLAAQTAAHLEKVHPGGKIVEGPNLRPQVTELVTSARQLYEETCILLREKAQNLRLREDLEGKLSAALGNMEMELRKCVTYDCAGLVHFQQPMTEEQGCSERKGRARGLFWLKFRRGERGGGSRSARDVATWGVAEVATWLETLQLSEYAESFTRHDIRGRELLTLGRRDLKELGVTKVGHVKRILQAVRDLTM